MLLAVNVVPLRGHPTMNTQSEFALPNAPVGRKPFSRRDRRKVRTYIWVFALTDCAATAATRASLWES